MSRASANTVSRRALASEVVVPGAALDAVDSSVSCEAVIAGVAA